MTEGKINHATLNRRARKEREKVLRGSLPHASTRGVYKRRGFAVDEAIAFLIKESALEAALCAEGLRNKQP